MASTLPLRLSDLVKKINIYVANNPVVPATTDTEWLIDTDLINQGITLWEGEREVEWKELWAGNVSLGVVSIGQVSLPLPDDFKWPGGFVRFVNTSGSVTRMPIVPLDHINNREQVEKNPQVCYVTGFPGSYVLNYGFANIAGGPVVSSTVYIDYYRFANQLSNPTDIPDMSDPMFLVWFAVAQRKLQTGDSDQYSVFNAMASESLRLMRVANFNTVAYHDNSLEDRDYWIDGKVLGF